MGIRHPGGSSARSYDPLPDALRQQIQAGEDLHTEFKQWPLKADDLAATLVAFANTDGGTLFLGVDDAGSIVGLDDPGEVSRTLDNAAVHNCERPLSVIQEVYDGGNGRAVVVARVARGDQRPYRTHRGIYYIRTSSGRRQASRQELLRLFQAVESLYYDETVVARTSVADLDVGAFERFLRSSYGKTLADFALPLEMLLRNLRLARDGRLTVAGVLLFGRQPQEWLPHAAIHMAHFPANHVDAPPDDRKDATGTLTDQLEDAQRFLGIHLRIAHRIQGFEPERRPELPEEPLREAVVNAMAHRDYTVQGPVRILVFPNRVEVMSPGGLPSTVDVESMRLGTHVPRNPILLSHLAKMGLVTAIGTGVPRIIARVREAVGREPELLARPNEFRVVIPRRSP